MRVKRFERGSAVYKCVSCKRATRNTGDEGQLELCYECFELAGLDNQINDSGEVPSKETKQYINELADRLRKHGVDMSKTWTGDYVSKYIKEVKA